MTASFKGEQSFQPAVARDGEVETAALLRLGVSLEREVLHLLLTHDKSNVPLMSVHEFGGNVEDQAREILEVERSGEGHTDLGERRLQSAVLECSLGRLGSSATEP